MGMSVADELDRLRASLPGCALVAFGDLGARIVLCASDAEKRPQEKLDALCLAADTCLNGDTGGGDALAGLLGDGGLRQAVALRPGGVTVFLRSSTDANDALFCAFTDQTDVPTVLTRADETLNRISVLG
jgi:hypothetical protein